MSCPDSIEIRPALPAATDWDAVLALILDAFAYMEARINPPSSAHRLTPQAMAEQAADGAVYLAEQNGDVVGCVFLTPKPDVLYLGKLAVRSDLRGCGLARRLVETAMSEARQRGLPEIELQARIELTENHAAFAAMGFHEVGRTAHAGYDRPTSVTMRRRI